MASFSKPQSILREFLSSEAAGGVVLMVASAVALIIANSRLSDSYFALLHVYIGPLSLLHWINDALMAVFFLLVGLEIKREMVDGQLATWPRRILPGLAAAGGMAVPAIIFTTLNVGDPVALRGWAIPTATDIAFALGVLSLLGSRVPVSMKVFLAALAIIDDLGAVLIIALVYTGGLNLTYALAAFTVLTGLMLLNRLNVLSLWPYVLLGLALWFCVLQSGVHPTLAGVALAMTVPIRPAPGIRHDVDASPLHRLEHHLQFVVPFAIVPIFGFANAGVSFVGASTGVFATPIALGVTLGLFLGKLAGVLGTTFVVIKLRLVDMPHSANWRHITGVSLLCGIGFTMSLFVGLLAYPESPVLQDQAKIGVLCGSLLSALAGCMVLMTCPRRSQALAAEMPGSVS